MPSDPFPPKILRSLSSESWCLRSLRQDGKPCRQGVLETDDLHLIALYDRYMAGSIAGLSISQDPEALDGCDVILEFSSPTSVMDHLAHWRQFGANVVVGTSGFDAERLAALGELWGNGPGNCLVVPNFSIGGVLMMKMAEMAAKYFKVGEIIEMHHDRKIDAPPERRSRRQLALPRLGSTAACGGI